MNLLNNSIKERITQDLSNAITTNEFTPFVNNIPEFINELYKNIPEKKRISYGIVYTIKTLSKFLFELLNQKNNSILNIGKEIYNKSEEFKARTVALGILSYYGITDYKSVLPFFEKSAVSSHWNEREIACILFRKIIKAHPEEIRKYLKKLACSEDQYLRRFVAETLRPVQENKWFFNNIDYPLSILKYMFKEASPYPRTSVGNNLSDISKKLPEKIFSIVEQLVNSGDKNSYWIAYRACRNLVKKYPERVMKLLKITEYKYKNKIYRLNG